MFPAERLVAHQKSMDGLHDPMWGEKWVPRWGYDCDRGGESPHLTHYRAEVRGTRDA